MFKYRTGGMDNMRTVGAKVSRETSVVIDEVEYPSLTIQSAKDDADINVIVRRFGVTGTLPQVTAMPSYADYEGIFDFHTAMNAVRGATEAFMALPSDIRKRFHNSEQEFLDFVSDEKNLDELRKMGLAKSKDPAIIAPPADVPPNVEKSDAGNPGK